MKTLFAYLSMLVIVAIFVADAFCVKSLGIWSILVCTLSIPLIGILVGVSVCCLDVDDEEN